MVNDLMKAMLRAILRKDVWETNKAAMQEDVFTSADVKSLVQYIGELHDERSGNLSVVDLRLAVEAKYRRPDGRKQELLDLVGLLDDAPDYEFEEIQPLIADYLGRELANQAAIHIGSRLETDRFDLEVPFRLLERGMEIASGMNLDVVDLIEADPTDEHEREGIATVGLGKVMDDHLGGGVANGEMLIWLALPGGGKTSYLKNQGMAMAMAGEHVLDITLEINGRKVRKRCDQWLTKLESEELLGRPKLVVSRRRELAGKYYVKDWCDRNVTCDDIRNLVKNMRAQGMEVTVISVDYLELMAPTKNNRHGERFNYSLIAKEMRRLANELDVKLITAWQINRAGTGKHVFGKEDVSECWDIIKHADIILGLNQNEEELDNHVMRVKIMKQRESTARPLEYYYSNLDRMDIRPSDSIEGDSDGPPEEVGLGNRPGVRQYRSGTEAG
jgi:KaiC/GvpD/RAD55 family RecA-like ATPase